MHSYQHLISLAHQLGPKGDTLKQLVMSLEKGSKSLVELANQFEHIEREAAKLKRWLYAEQTHVLHDMISLKHQLHNELHQQLQRDQKSDLALSSKEAEQLLIKV